MQYPSPKYKALRRVIWFSLVCWLIWPPLALTAVARNREGTLSGTVAYFDSGGAFIDNAAGVSLEFIVRKSKRVIVADENGDFYEKLPVGRYCLVRVLDASGRKLQTAPRRYSNTKEDCFIIRNSKLTRWDLELPYHAAISSNGVLRILGLEYSSPTIEDGEIFVAHDEVVGNVRE